jgi:hypothetical protein
MALARGSAAGSSADALRGRGPSGNGRGDDAAPAAHVPPWVRLLRRLGRGEAAGAVLGEIESGCTERRVGLLLLLLLGRGEGVSAVLGEAAS